MDCKHRELISGYCVNTGKTAFCKQCYYMDDSAGKVERVNGIELLWRYTQTARGKTKAEVVATTPGGVYREAAIRETKSAAIQAASLKLNRSIKRFSV